MQDLTTGPVRRHLLTTTGFMLVTMVFQTLYFLVDLYWVGRLGTEAVAAVGIAGNLNFVVLALSQMLGVGATTAVAHASGRRDRDAVLLAFNQAQLLAMLTGVLFLALGLALRDRYVAAMSADAATARLASEYLLWFVPALALQYALVAMSAALRGSGNFKPGMIVSSGSVVLNMVLAPFLIFGWGTGRAFGVAGAAVSTFVSVALGVVWLGAYFLRPDSFLKFTVGDWRPRLALWRRMIAVGLPAGFEFAMMAVYMVVVYAVARPFGAAAQAGFGVGMRIVQAGFMPVVALGFSVAPVAGQNFGARRGDRVRETFRQASLMAAVAMAVLVLLCHIAPASLIAIFAQDPAAVAVGEEYLRIVSWNFVASGLIFVTSSMFQAMGNTIPSLAVSALRMAVVVLPLSVLARLPGFELRWIWYLTVVAVFLALALSWLLLRREFERRLVFDEPVVGVMPAV